MSSASVHLKPADIAGFFIPWKKGREVYPDKRSFIGKSLHPHHKAESPSVNPEGFRFMVLKRTKNESASVRLKPADIAGFFIPWQFSLIPEPFCVKYFVKFGRLFRLFAIACLRRLGALAERGLSSLSASFRKGAIPAALRKAAATIRGANRFLSSEKTLFL
jgi:hypothetical protein